MSSSSSETHLTRLLDRLEAHAHSAGSSGSSTSQAGPKSQATDKGLNGRGLNGGIPKGQGLDDSEVLIDQLPEAFLLALDSAGPGLVAASLDRLDGLLKTDLRRKNPTLYGLCLGIRPQLLAASGRTQSNWTESGLEAGGDSAVDSSGTSAGQKPRSLKASVSELFRWAGYRVEAMPDSGAYDSEASDSEASDPCLLRVTHDAGPLVVRALVSCVEGLPTEEAIQRLAQAVQCSSSGEETGSGSPYRGVLVFGRGLMDAEPEVAGSLAGSALKHAVELKTESELLCSLVDMPEAAAVALRPFRGSELESRYVEQEAVLEKDLLKKGLLALEKGQAADGGEDSSASDRQVVTRELTPWVDTWLESDGNFLALLGDFGIGKTSFCRRFAAKLATDWQPGRRLPVLIDLREHLSGSITPEGLLARHFRHLGIRSAHSGALLRLSEEGQLVLILDGFGEMVAHAETGLHLTALRRLMGLAQGRAKVILTCRTHYFRDSPEEVWRLSTSSDGPTSVTPLFEELKAKADTEIAYLCEFSGERVETYLRQAVPDDFHRLKELLRSSYHLKSLAGRPFLLRMIIEALPRIESGRGEASLAGLYESYCDQWLRPQAEKSSVGRRLRQRLVEQLARRIWSGVERVDHAELLASVLKSGPADGKSDDQNDDQNVEDLDPRSDEHTSAASGAVDGATTPAEVDQALRRAPFLHRDGKARYGFVHRSFLEFFLARSLRRGIAGGHGESLDLPSLTREVAFFLECWREATDIPRFAGRVLTGSYVPRISENALLILAFHARSRLGPLLGPGVEEVEERLAVELPRAFATVRPATLNLQGADFTGMDLRALDLASGDFRGTMLERADLRFCRFDGSDLSGARLRGADLRSAGLEGTTLEEVDLREADLRGADLRLARCARADFTDARIEDLATDGATFLATRGLPADLLASAIEVSPVFQSGHSWRVCDVAWHPELPLVASAAEDGAILVWNVVANRLLRRLSGHGRAVNAVTWNVDGKRLASGSEDRTVRIWDAESGRLLHHLKGHTAGVSDLDWDGAGQRLVSASEDHCARIWDAETGRCLQVLEGHSDRINAVAWDRSSDRLATGSDDWTVRIWDAGSGSSTQMLATQVLAGHSDGVHAVDWSPGGHRLASGSDDWTVRIWNPKTGRSTRTLSGHSEGVHAVAWHPTGQRLASGAFDRSIRLWDADTGRALGKLLGHSGWVRALSWSPSGRRLASGASSRAVRLWDVEERRSTHRLAGFAGWINTVAWAPDGSRLATGSSGRVVRVWNRADGSSRVLEGHEDRVHTVAWDPSGRRLASGADDRTVRIWDADQARVEHVLEGHAGWIRAVVWSPDGSRLASGADDRAVRIWQTETGECEQVFEGHSGWVRALAWDPADQFVASGADDGTVKLWHLASGQQTHTLGGHGAWVLAIAWDSTGRRLASGTADGQVRIWDAQGARKTHQLEPHESWVHTVAWSASGDRLLSVSVDGCVRISDAHTGKCLHTLDVGFVWHAAWLGNLLALASPEGKVALWRLDQPARKIADLWGTPQGGLVVTHEGLVEGDAEALDWIRFVDEGWAVYALDELAGRHDPQGVARTLAAT